MEVISMYPTSGFGPTQMARLLQLILLVHTLWPICWRRDSSPLRRRSFAAGNLLGILREQEHKVKKADVAAAVPKACTRQVGASGCVVQVCRCCQPAVSSPALQEGSMALLPSSWFHPSPGKGRLPVHALSPKIQPHPSKSRLPENMAF